MALQDNSATLNRISKAIFRSPDFTGLKAMASQGVKVEISGDIEKQQYRIVAS
jgi:hypothetical protein